jgi:3'-phosphoadenosine 5'-phosphosulfate sulfotransferase (PAPS reductase)/FAD synthetase
MSVKTNYDQIKEKFRKHFELITDNYLEKIISSCKCIDELDLINKKIYFSFNGGKDCLAAYIILKYYLFCQDQNISYFRKESFKKFCETNHEYKIRNCKVEFVYFLNKNNFKEEMDYVIRFSKLEKIETFFMFTDYITGLNYLIKNFDLKLILMGTRKDDLLKYTTNINKDIEEKLSHPSTHPYPDFMRFYPIFNFTFDDIWRIILITRTEYLSLYDKGYSSIGKINNTFLNESLKLESSDEYLPSWCLEEYLSERNFRK